MKSTKYSTTSERETFGIARDFGTTLAPGDIIALEGDLGAGKTVFARGIADSLASPDEVTSPTFTLINEYRGTIPMYHMDLYRINTLDDLIDIGIEDYLYGDGICVIEWAERLGTIAPADIIRVNISHGGGNDRSLTINRNGDGS